MNAEPHIFTLTGNLLAERTFEFETWAPARTQRAQRASFQVGGKGINVAKMLRRLGAKYTALAFSGGPNGAECEAWLRERGIATQFFPTTTPTRGGLVVRGGGYAETTFLAPDAAPDAAAIRACAGFLAAQPAGAVLAVCGSFPGWPGAEYDPLREAIHRWPERGVLVVDSYGPPLAWLANETAAFTRVNRDEFNSLLTAADRKRSSGELLHEIRDKVRAHRWAVTDGGAPVWYMGEHRDPETLPVPPVRLVSPTGSGDVMLACVLHARFYRELAWRDAVAWSLPYAAANAGHAGIAEFPEPKAAE